jgi:outer membrane protein assembly factor BamB
MKSALLPLLLLSATLHAADWPMYRGPEHNGISKETGWKNTWPDDGPKIAWKAGAGIGFSSFAAVGKHVFTAGFANEEDTVFCLDAETGKVVWKHSFPSELGDKYYEGGTSATPTVADGNVYHLSRWGDAMCLDAATGKVVWQKNPAKDHEMPIPDWGFAGSPLVQGGLVFLTIGQNGMALSKATGEVKWKSAGKPAGYSTPLPGQDGLVYFSSDKTYSAIDGATGTLRWEFPWKTQYGVNAAEPVVDGSRVFIASGYNKGCTLLDVSGAQPAKVWENRVMRSQFNSCVLVDGHLYGPDGNDGDKGALKCVEFATGNVKWEHKGFGVGGVTVADGQLIALSHRGELMIAPVSAEKFAPSAKAEVLTGRCWTTPVLAHGRIYCRNAQGQIVCVDVR